MKKPLLHIVTALTCLLLSTQTLLAQAPTLGRAANFVLFTRTGAITNTGTSHFTGDVGTNAGSSTGFGNENGTMHDNDGASGGAAADLLIAYNQLNSAIPTSFPAPLLGNGQVLTAGVYKTTGVTTLSGDLTLDAQNNANAVFIIQIQAAFSVNANAKVKLVNGAQACNVFWKVEGLASLATAVSFKGNLVVNNAAIALSANDTLEGRALSTAGAITTNTVLAYTPIGCGSPLLTGPAAPNLAAVGIFAIFSGNGPVTNSGVSYVTGDVGTNVGLTTGFNPLFVTGTIHPIPDGATAAAAASLLNVYSYLNTLPHDIELLYPAQFGNNLVLTPHTYLMNAATSFNGTVFLNAQGNADAVFVIKINGALTTSTFSKVELINGTQAKNVYWKIDGAVNINDNSIFNGTIVANNGAIDLKTGTTLTGRALTTNGAISTSAINASVPSAGSFPVTWLYFRGKPTQSSVVLEWSTKSEINNSYFTIEKSSDGRNFETLASVSAKTESTSADYQYGLVDNQPLAIGYYRISQTDKDGARSYYTTIQIKSGTSQVLRVSQSVQQNTIVIQASGATQGKGSIELYSLDGRKMSSQSVTLTKELSTYRIASPKQKGIYLLSIQSEGKKLYTSKIAVL